MSRVFQVPAAAGTEMSAQRLKITVETKRRVFGNLICCVALTKRAASKAWLPEAVWVLSLLHFDDEVQKRSLDFFEPVWHSGRNHDDVILGKSTDFAAFNRQTTHLSAPSRLLIPLLPPPPDRAR